jgi:hypothetical protein
MKLSPSKVLITVTLACCALTSSAGGVRGGVWTYPGGASEKPVIEQAITAVIGATPSSNFRKLFERQLRLRGEVVSDRDKLKYWQELKAKPELRNTPIYGTESEQSRTVLKKLKPIFAIFGRKWDVAVIEQDAPFSGAFRQCIYIVSTGLLGMINDVELRSFAAHELAHECFIAELREADRTGCLMAYYLVELKSDLIAALACLLLKYDPLSLTSGVARIEAYYLSIDPGIVLESKHPTLQQRLRCLKMFLAKIGHHVSDVLKHKHEGQVREVNQMLG